MICNKHRYNFLQNKLSKIKNRKANQDIMITEQTFLWDGWTTKESTLLCYISLKLPWFIHHSPCQPKSTLIWSHNPSRRWRAQLFFCQNLFFVLKKTYFLQIQAKHSFTKQIKETQIKKDKYSYNQNKKTTPQKLVVEIEKLGIRCHMYSVTMA